nr:hypothetical protein [Streptomyces tsukubensis NRRL18488]
MFAALRPRHCPLRLVLLIQCEPSGRATNSHCWWSSSPFGGRASTLFSAAERAKPCLTFWM